MTTTSSPSAPRFRTPFLRVLHLSCLRNTNMWEFSWLLSQSSSSCSWVQLRVSAQVSGLVLMIRRSFASLLLQLLSSVQFPSCLVPSPLSFLVPPRDENCNLCKCKDKHWKLEKVLEKLSHCCIQIWRSYGFSACCKWPIGLYITINLFKIYYGDDWEGLFEAITGYGLGGSSMALFGRVGGGIYTKAADVGADLVGKVERNIPEDDPRNPAVIADNVGDNVGDIAGMGSDLFGSYAEASCAALVVASISSFGITHDFTGMCYPLLISSMGILVCLITTLFATDFFEIKAVKEIEPALKNQLIISTILMTVGIAIVTWTCLPSSFTIFNFGVQKDVKNWQLFLCVCVGLWAGLIIGFVTEYYTSNAYSPVQDVADSCRTGAATNVIFGLALGYKSVIIPIFAIAVGIFVSFTFAAMYGIAVAALGMLSTIATGLAIDAYGPISDNAGGIAEMAGMSHRIRERTDALDAAGNTTAAIGKGFAIGSAALVSLALFGAFVSRAGISSVDVLTPKVFIGLLVGAMLPYWFSAMTMKSVGSAALKMVEEVRRQFNTIPGLMEGLA
ncbi:pyrophosphate-energized vacuolar membrane proton pump 1-like, partial [Salvia miltiorrhiza]|uniref:pyrophosphate-energized vacuolar membrane proton pump 1-like n=1 Tax=Salvia miltiorrhiza TaxID=226208 RepID=UPI0025ACF7AA